VPELVLDHWVEEFTALHGAGRISVAGPPAAWTGVLDLRRSDKYGIAFCSSSEQLMTRESRHVRSDPRGTFELLVPFAGTAGTEQDRTWGQIRPGQMALVDVDRPLRFRHDADFRSVAFLMPADEIIGRSPAARHGATLLDATSGLGRVVQQMVRTLHEEQHGMTPAAFDQACESLLDLVGLAADGGGAPPSSVEADIRRHVRTHAADPTLDVTSIANELGWSPRYIQQIMRAAGTTPRDLIRHERLRLARSRLSSPRWATRSIGQIAHECGFGSQAVFATAFRQHYNMTPSDARSSDAGSPPSSS
jgi:AraC-like DNA-binding protein